MNFDLWFSKGQSSRGFDKKSNLLCRATSYNFCLYIFYTTGLSHSMCGSVKINAEYINGSSIVVNLYLTGYIIAKLKKCFWFVFSHLLHMLSHQNYECTEWFMQWLVCSIPTTQLKAHQIHKECCSPSISQSKMCQNLSFPTCSEWSICTVHFCQSSVKVT